MIHKVVDIQVDYKKADAVQDGSQPQLYTYIQERSEELTASEKRPAVIICPGGAYRFKSDRNRSGGASISGSGDAGVRTAVQCGSFPLSQCASGTGGGSGMGEKSRREILD